MYLSTAALPPAPFEIQKKLLSKNPKCARKQGNKEKQEANQYSKPSYNIKALKIAAENRVLELDATWCNYNIHIA